MRRVGYAKLVVNRVTGNPHNSAAIVDHDRHCIAVATRHFAVDEEVLKLLLPVQAKRPEPVARTAVTNRQWAGAHITAHNGNGRIAPRSCVVSRTVFDGHQTPGFREVHLTRNRQRIPEKVRALRGEPLVIHGSGAQTRQFTHASDIGGAFVAAARRETHDRVFNIVAERAISIRELAEQVASLVPTSVRFGPSRPGDVPSARVSSARAERELGWRAEADFARALALMVEERSAYATTSEGAAVAG